MLRMDWHVMAWQFGTPADSGAAFTRPAQCQQTPQTPWNACPRVGESERNRRQIIENWGPRQMADTLVDLVDAMPLDPGDWPDGPVKWVSKASNNQHAVSIVPTSRSKHLIPGFALISKEMK